MRKTPIIIKGKLNNCPIFKKRPFSKETWFSLKNSTKILTIKVKVRNMPKKYPSPLEFSSFDKFDIDSI